MKSTKTRILEEAARQLALAGYAAFSVASVREALQVSSGSMFHAYASKAELAAAVYVEGIADYHRAANSALERSSDAKLALRGLIRAHLLWVQEHRGLAAFLFSTLPDEVAAEAAPALSALNTAFHLRLDAFYSRARVQGLMGSLERQVAHALCIGPSQEYCRQWIRGNATKPPATVLRTIERAALAALRSTLPIKSCSPRAPARASHRTSTRSKELRT